MDGHGLGAGGYEITNTTTRVYATGDRRPPGAADRVLKRRGR